MTQQDWIDTLNSDPDPNTRLVYSDWLEDHGRLDEAAGWRHLVSDGRAPFPFSYNTTYGDMPNWVYSWQKTGGSWNWDECYEELGFLVRVGVFKHLISNDKVVNSIGYKSRYLAESDLVKALILAGQLSTV